MKKNTIDLIRALDWRSDAAVKQSAMEELANLDGEDLKLLLQPVSNKDCWEGAALVLKKIGYPRIHVVIPGLLEWIADMNWPGADTIFELLLSVDEQVLAAHLKDALIKAKAENDVPWIEWMRELIHAKKIERFLDEPELREILKLPDEEKDRE